MNTGGIDGAHDARPPRVLLVSQPTSAGTARHVADLAAGLLGMGLDVAVACPDDGGLGEKLRRSGVPVSVLPMRREISPIADIGAFLALRRLIRRMRPDVLHLHSSKAGFLGRLAGHASGVPVVVFTPHCWSFQSASGRKRAFYVVLERFASRFCDATVTVSRQEAEEAQQERVAPANRIRVIPNGVSEDEFRPYARYERDVPFLTVGRLDEQKGYTYLLKAMAELVRQEPSASLTIVGDGTLRRELEGEAASLGVSGHVEFAGERSDVRSFLHRSQVFVLSSLWEGLPYTILEAMAADLPVISTDVGGCRELVIEGETGMLVPAKDPRALAGAMLRLYRDESLRVRMGRAGHMYALRGFRLQDTVRKNAELYQELLERHSEQPLEVTPSALFKRSWIAILLVLALGLGGWAVADEVRYRDRIRPGVKVGSADVGGRNVDDAVRRLRELTAGPVTMLRSDETSGIPVDTSKVDFDLIGAAQEAYLVGRVGALPERVQARLKAARGRVEVPLSAPLEGPVAELLGALRLELDRAPVDAGFEIVDDELKIVDDEQGVSVDEAAFLERLGAAATARGGGRTVRVPLKTAPAKVTAEAAGALFPKAEEWTDRVVTGRYGGGEVPLTREQIARMLIAEGGELGVSGEALMHELAGRISLAAPVSARFSVEGGQVRIMDGAPGMRLDATSTAQALAEALESDTDGFDVVLTRREPAVTRGDLEQLGIARQLSSYTTRFRLGQDGRDTNIILSSEAFRGTVLGIGEVFSLNKTTGPRNRSTGYQESLVFMNGKVVPGVGGGVCQVSSTTYQAALRANLRIVDRSSHSMAVSYMDPGLDATAYYPVIDLKFQNSTDGPILLWSDVTGDELTVSVYGSGEKPDVRIKTVVKRVIPQKEQLVYDRTLPKGQRVVESEGIPGYVVISYREVYEAGRMVSRKLLATDEYRPRDRVIRVGS